MYQAYNDKSIKSKLPYKVGQICRNISTGEYIIIIGYRKRNTYLDNEPATEIVCLFIVQGLPGQIREFTIKSMKLVYVEEELWESRRIYYGI